MPSWLSSKVPLMSGNTATGVSSADELASMLEQRAQSLASPQSAAWLLVRWTEQCSSSEPAYIVQEPESRTGETWHLTFLQALLRSSAFETALEKCSKVSALRASLQEPGEPSALANALQSLAQVLLIPGAMNLWPVLLRTVLTGDAAGGPLPWGSWARRLIAGLKKSWRCDALPGTVKALEKEMGVSAGTLQSNAAPSSKGSTDRIGRTGSAGQGEDGTSSTAPRSKQDIKVRMLRQQMPQAATKAFDLRNRTDMLCKVCELLSNTRAIVADTHEVEQLLADAGVASDVAAQTSAGLEQDSIGSGFGEVGQGLQEQITGVMLTQESFSERRTVLTEERDRLNRRIKEIDEEVGQINQEESLCAQRIQALRLQFENNKDHFEGLQSHNLCSQRLMSDRKLKAANLQELAQAALQVAKSSAAHYEAELAAQFQRRRGDLVQACVAYLQQERLRLQLAGECLSVSAAGRAQSIPLEDGSAGEVPEETAEAVSAAQDVWRSAQAMLQRVDNNIGFASVPEAGATAAEAADDLGDVDAVSPLSNGAARDALDFFTQEAISGRRSCVECDSAEGDWASVSHGVYLCVECAGRHRGLGVHVSFVRSLSMDVWSNQQLQRMKLGGNKRFQTFLSGYPQLRGLAETPTALRERYASRAVAYYRRLLAAECKGMPLHASPPPASEGHLAAANGHVRTQDVGSAGTAADLDSERKALEAAYREHQQLLRDALSPGAI
mmetsp:Transcript_65392/g.156366  ORF Transcript_65392/g.156366 Transcript_65392/m.156366 type:complete len:727 (+) Transcript_65392:138-2318(+)